jgi:hypothetical protein
MGDQPVVRQNNANTDMHPRLQWDSNPMFERVKTRYALDPTAIVIDKFRFYVAENTSPFMKLFIV